MSQRKRSSNASPSPVRKRSTSTPASTTARPLKKEKREHAAPVPTPQTNPIVHVEEKLNVWGPPRPFVVPPGIRQLRWQFDCNNPCLFEVREELVPSAREYRYYITVHATNGTLIEVTSPEAPSPFSINASFGPKGSGITVQDPDSPDLPQKLVFYMRTTCPMGLFLNRAVVAAPGEASRVDLILRLDVRRPLV